MQEEKPEPPKPKRARYVSCRFDEFERLRDLGFQERWLYLELKWLANFKTGIGGRFRKQRLTYEDLAVLMRHPTGQGTASQPIDRSTARRLMLRLEAAGLVSSIGQREENGGLTFVLPHSPIKKAAKLPQDEATESTATPCPERKFDEPTPTLSVLINPQDINTPFNTAQSGEDEWDFSGADHAGAKATPPTETATTPAALTTSYVIERLDAEGFLFVRSDQSRRIYSRWIEERLSPERFERALHAVKADAMARRSPDEIAERIRGWKRRGLSRGRVAL